MYSPSKILTRQEDFSWVEFVTDLAWASDASLTSVAPFALSRMIRAFVCKAGAWSLRT